MTVKIDFLISPAYSVPPISTSARDGMEDDERLAPRPVLVRVGLDLGRVEDDRVGLEVGELGLLRVDEERLGEERVPRRTR